MKFSEEEINNAFYNMSNESLYEDYDEELTVHVLTGKTIASITGLYKDSEEVSIKTIGGDEYSFVHLQDCCEHVSLEDFEADSDDFKGAVILSAEIVASNSVSDDDMDISETWTFYKIETTKGGIWLRWYGTSNGYYSEQVDFVNKSKAFRQFIKKSENNSCISYIRK